MECSRAQWSDLVWINLNLQLFPEYATPVLPSFKLNFPRSASIVTFTRAENWKPRKVKKSSKQNWDFMHLPHTASSLALYTSHLLHVKFGKWKRVKWIYLSKHICYMLRRRESITFVLCAIMQRTKHLNNFRVSAWWRESGWTTTFLESTTSDNGEYNKYLTRKVRLQLSAAFSIIARSFPSLLSRGSNDRRSRNNFSFHFEKI